ncbi:hypothetical protein ES703_54791 [subsurface metagenome]
MSDEPKENYFDIRIRGSSTIYTEQELTDLLYEFLKNKAEFQIQ